ncbi:MAG TPA: hypothetical protein VLJ58_03375 [Ramlibacter sp.]|nr:hypothetical protein [Ramlibacter sp.]
MEQMASELGQCLGHQLRFHQPEGGMFLWVTLQAGIDSEALFKAAAPAFQPNRATMRLSFTGPTWPDICKGVARLRRVFENIFFVEE